MIKNLLLLVLLFTVHSATAQYFKVSGKITNNKLEPLFAASIQVRGEKTGTTSKEDGTWQLLLEEGQYELIISMVGFKTQKIELVITKDYIQNIILEQQEDLNLEEVVLKTKYRDKSEEYIRQVIRHKDSLLAASGPYSCEVYIKATQQDSLPPKIKLKKPLPDSLIKKPDTLGRMSMAEISVHYDHETDDKVKEIRDGVVKRGNPESLFYLTLTDGNFNIYNNLLRARGVSQMPFISPVSYGGLAAYRYKLIDISTVNGHKIFTIGFRPKELSNVTTEGELKILDSAWVVLSARYTLPVFHIPAYDYFEVKQQYEFVNQKAWMITSETFTYFTKHGKGKQSGQTVASYRNFELGKNFPPKYFGLEVSATKQEAYERDSSFWQKSRTIPLTSKEVKFIQYRDSIYRATHSKAYLDSIDKKTNKFTLKKLLLTGQTLYNREKERTIFLMPITALYNPVQFGGGRLRIYGSLNKVYKSKKNINLFTDLSYGFRNHDVNGNIRFVKLYNPFTRAFYRLEVERDFKYIYEGDAWINLIKRNNFYLNNGIGFGHWKEMANGLTLYTDLDIAFRRSLSNYKTGSKIDSLFPDWLDNNQAVAFDPYNAVYGKISLQYTPGQKFIREPREKIILGSKFPTFFITWRKGIPGLLNSKVDFDFLEYGLKQEIKLGTTGISHYTIKSGSYITKKDLRFVDYQFQRRGDPIFFGNPDEAFQALDSTFPLFKRYYQGHFLHEFNGALLNKIPFLKKLQLREIAGGGFLIAPERDLRYGELFAGVERVFKWPFNPLYKFKLGVYIVGSAANQFSNPVMFKIGVTSWDMKRKKWM